MPPAELYATYRYTQLYIDKILSELNAAVLVNGFRLRSAIAVVELCMVYFINRKTMAVFSRRLVYRSSTNTHERP